METINCIKARRSIRLFLDKKISREVISQILECAITAPSSVDCQPWHFIVVEEKEAQKKLAELKSESNQQHILSAPVTIVVCVDINKSPSRYIEDGVTATQNILLAVHDLGLGSVYVTGCKLSKPEVAKNVRAILKLPDNIMPITILPIGYPDSSEVLENKELLNLDKVVHFDNW
ncbi:nitroreductase family protein [bacterium]|nr:nitroreductase family protein [bacterium]